MPTPPAQPVTTDATSWGGFVSWGATLLGSASFMAGIGCLISHALAGTLFSTGPCLAGEICQPGITVCLALLAAGAATASPGLQTAKVGMFARPASQQTGPVTEKR